MQDKKEDKISETKVEVPTSTKPVTDTREEAVAVEIEYEVSDLYLAAYLMAQGFYVYNMKSKDGGKRVVFTLRGKKTGNPVLLLAEILPVVNNWSLNPKKRKRLCLFLKDMVMELRKIEIEPDELGGNEEADEIDEEDYGRQSLINAFYTGRAIIDPLQFKHKLKDLKSLIHDAKPYSIKKVGGS